MRYTITIGHRPMHEVPNHLRPNGPKRKVREVPIQSLAMARAVLETFRDSTGSGASCCCDGFGDIEDETGEVVARVSYNGRIWGLAGNEVTNPRSLSMDLSRYFNETETAG